MIIPDKCFWVKEKLNSRENRVLNFKVFHDQNIWNIVYWPCNRFEERLAVSELPVWCRIIIMYLLLMIKSSRSFILKALQGPLTKWYLSRATGEPSYWACGSNSSKVFAAPEIAIPVWADATTKPFYLYKVEVQGNWFWVNSKTESDSFTDLDVSGSEQLLMRFAYRCSFSLILCELSGIVSMSKYRWLVTTHSHSRLVPVTLFCRCLDSWPRPRGAMRSC